MADRTVISCGGLLIELHDDNFPHVHKSGTGACMVKFQLVAEPVAFG